jgi:hypothetical protein
MIAFADGESGKIRNVDIHDQSLIVLFSPPVTASGGPTRTWVELRAKQLTGADLNTTPAASGKGCTITAVAGIPPRNPDGTPKDVLVNGAIFSPAQSWIGGDYRVILKSDFVRDAKDKAVDGDHLPPWVPTAKSGDRIQGGTFESWFSIGQG